MNCDGSPEGAAAGERAKRFVADNMLGRLARWLRMMGYDTLYVKSGDDREIADISAREGRVLLTRDRQLTLRKGVIALYIGEVDLEKQLEHVAREFSLSFREKEMRCSDCNGVLRDAAPDEVRSHVPDGVLGRNDRFCICTSCSKIYWRGSHWNRIADVASRCCP